MLALLLLSVCEDNKNNDNNNKNNSNTSPLFLYEKTTQMKWGKKNNDNNNKNGRIMIIRNKNN